MSKTIVPLDGTWLLKGFAPQALCEQEAAASGTDDSWIPARVPGDVHTALLARGLLPDPMMGENVQQCGWVNERDWLLSRSFRADLPPGRRARLVFRGIDTLATVWLNGTKLGHTDNMFREYRFDITDIIQPGGENTLRLRISSIRQALRELPRGKYFALFDDRRIFLRKAQYQFGWDWSPDLPSAGIWRSCALEAVDEHEIVDVAVRPRLGGSVSFFITTDLPPQRTELDGVEIRYQPEALGLQLSIALFDREERPVAEEALPVSSGQNYATLRIPEPRLWWPNGYGEPYLYSYRVRLLKQGVELDCVEGRVGLREVRLCQDPLSGREFSFRFEINGVPVYSKGANWVPAELFVGETRRERYKALIERAREAHFNTLRVWGGGIYESDLFYDLCDEQGIMVWQEFMCSCSDLPGDQDGFLRGIIPEVEYQVRRLRNHPSIIYWTGGNETAEMAGYRPSFGHPILHYLVRGICADLDPTRPYAASSPTSFSDLGSDPHSGDCHLSAYEQACLHGIRSHRAELRRMRTKFNSECAYQGPLRYRSLVKFMPADRLWPINDLWDFRNQKNPYSWFLRETYSRSQLALAEEAFGEVTGLKDFLKKGMTAHAELLAAEIEYHRSRKWENGGLMFWMYNDCWPTGTHSVIDYYLLPKPAFYAAKRSYRPLIVTLQRDGEEDAVYLVNDLLRPVTGELEVGQADLAGTVLWRRLRRISVAANAAERVENFGGRALKAPNTYLFARLASDAGAVSCTFFPGYGKGIAWPDPAITWKLVDETEKDGRFVKTLAIRTGAYARMVNLSHPFDERLTYSDNFFDLEAGAEKVVAIQAREDFAAPDLRLAHWLTDWD